VTVPGRVAKRGEKKKKVITPYNDLRFGLLGEPAEKKRGWHRHSPHASRS